MQIGDADYAEKIFVQGCISLRPKQNMRKLLIILGVPIDDLTLPAALDQIDEFVEIGRATGTSHQIATINADFVTKALDDPELRLILQEADMATADGMPLVWGARLLGVPLEGRVTGADLVPALAERAAQKGYSMYMLGAAPGIAQRAADILCERYPGLKIAGVYSPPPSSVLEMDASVAQRVQDAKPDILLVAFGNPKQEKWINMYAHQIRVPVMIGVGGTLDFIAGVTKRAPEWMQRTGLEWSYRLMQEPRRLWKRYVVDMFGFGTFFIRQWWLLRQRPAPAAALPTHDTILVGDTAVINLNGRLDVNSAQAFGEQAEQALGNAPRIVVNLEHTEFIDSRGMGALVALSKRARDAHGQVYLAAVPPPIAQTLQLMRLDKLFESFPTVTEALGAHREMTAANPASTKSNSAWTVIAVPRRLDAESAPAISAQTEQVIETNPRVVLDFHDTAFITSAGLAVLVKLQKLAQARGGALHLASCSADVVQVLRLVKLDRVLPMFPDVLSAQAAV